MSHFGHSWKIGCRRHQNRWKISRFFRISFRFHLGQMCKKFQLDRIPFTMEKMSLNMKWRGWYFFTRVFPKCTSITISLYSGINHSSIRFFFSTYVMYRSEGYFLKISLISMQQFGSNDQLKKRYNSRGLAAEEVTLASRSLSPHLPAKRVKIQKK